MDVDWSSFALGALAPVAMLAAGAIAVAILVWFRWWFVQDDGQFHGGRGFPHVADYYSETSERWYLRGQHMHLWPPDTPNWLIRRLEPLRVWLCLRYTPHRAPTPKADE